jgi:hypothetical protein
MFITYYYVLPFFFLDLSAFLNILNDEIYYNHLLHTNFFGGTNGTYNGIVPILCVFNYTDRYVDQGGCKRKGMVYTEILFFFIPIHLSSGILTSL